MTTFRDAEECPHCGSVSPPSDAGWFPTDEQRIVVDGEHPAEVVGTIPVGGLFPRTESVNLKILPAAPRYVTERLWVRKWAQSEWRRM